MLLRKTTLAHHPAFRNPQAAEQSMSADSRHGRPPPTQRARNGCALARACVLASDKVRAVGPGVPTVRAPWSPSADRARLNGLMAGRGGCWRRVRPSWRVLAAPCSKIRCRKGRQTPWARSDHSNQAHHHQAGPASTCARSRSPARPRSSWKRPSTQTWAEPKSCLWRSCGCKKANPSRRE